MARRRLEELFNHHIGVEMGEVPDPETSEALGGAPATQPLWYVVLTDRDTGDVIRFALTRKGRDGLVRDLTGGIVLAGGELPKL